LHREKSSYREWTRTNIYKPLKITIMDDKKKKIEDKTTEEVSGGYMDVLAKANKENTEE